MNQQAKDAKRYHRVLNDIKLIYNASKHDPVRAYTNWAHITISIIVGMLLGILMGSGGA